MKKFFLIAPFIILLSACNQNRFKIDLKKSDLNVTIERFDKDIFALDTNNIEAGLPALKAKYGNFFDMYTQHILNLEKPGTPEFYTQFREVLTDSAFRSVYEESQAVFADVSGIERKLTVAFKYLEHYFPQMPLPRVYMHVSGFNQQIALTDDAMSASIDDYLGSDYEPYQGRMYNYQLIAMTPEKVPSDYMTAWLMSEFPFNSSSGILLDYMLDRGKIMFLLETIMPDEKEETLMAYTPEQLQWCYDNEKAMWVTMGEKRRLFDTDRMIIAKYINEAPFTVDFFQESPGRAGIWIGWQIVRAYMKNNTDVTLPGLMRETDYQMILEKSRYKP